MYIFNLYFSGLEEKKKDQIYQSFGFCNFAGSVQVQSIISFYSSSFYSLA